MSYKQHICILVIGWILLNHADKIKVIPGDDSETTYPLQNKTEDFLTEAANKPVPLITNTTENDENKTLNQLRNTTQSHLSDKTTHSFGVPLLAAFILMSMVFLATLLVVFRAKKTTVCRNSQSKEHNTEEMETT